MTDTEADAPPQRADFEPSSPARTSRSPPSRTRGARRSSVSSASCNPIRSRCPWVVLFGSALIFSALVGTRFYHPYNLSLVLQQVTIIAIIGIAQTTVILTAASISRRRHHGADLHGDGSLAVKSGVPDGFALLIGMASALPPAPSRLLVTSCGCRRSSSRSEPGASSARSISVFREPDHPAQEVAAAAPLMQATGWATTISAARITTRHGADADPRRHRRYVLNRTAFGRHVYATGDDPSRAPLRHQHGPRPDRGLRARRPRVGDRRLRSSAARRDQPDLGSGANLDSITATVIGGTSLFGGRARSPAPWSAP